MARKEKKTLKYEGINKGVHPTQAKMTFRFEWNLEGLTKRQKLSLWDS